MVIKFFQILNQVCHGTVFCQIRQVAGIAVTAQDDIDLAGDLGDDRVEIIQPYIVLAFQSSVGIVTDLVEAGDIVREYVFAAADFHRFVEYVVFDFVVVC